MFVDVKNARALKVYYTNIELIAEWDQSIYNRSLAFLK